MLGEGSWAGPWHTQPTGHSSGPLWMLWGSPWTAAPSLPPSLCTPVPGTLPHRLHQEDGSRVPLGGMGAPGHTGRAPRVTGGLETSLSGEGISLSKSGGPRHGQGARRPPTHRGSRPRSAGAGVATPLLPPGTGVRALGGAGEPAAPTCLRLQLPVVGGPVVGVRFHQEGARHGSPARGSPCASGRRPRAAQRAGGPRLGSLA